MHCETFSRMTSNPAMFSGDRFCMSRRAGQWDGDGCTNNSAWLIFV